VSSEQDTGAVLLAELVAIRASIGEVRERLVAIEAGQAVRAERSAAHAATLTEVEARLRALEIAGAGVSTRLAMAGSGGGMIVGAAVAYLSKVVFGG